MRKNTLQILCCCGGDRVFISKADWIHCHPCMWPVLWALDSWVATYLAHLLHAHQWYLHGVHSVLTRKAVWVSPVCSTLRLLLSELSLYYSVDCDLSHQLDDLPFCVFHQGWKYGRPSWNKRHLPCGWPDCRLVAPGVLTHLLGPSEARTISVLASWLILDASLAHAWLLSQFPASGCLV